MNEVDYDFTEPAVDGDVDWDFTRPEGFESRSGKIGMYVLGALAVWYFLLR